MAIIISILFIVVGLGGVFARDFLWKIQEYSNRSGGIAHSERTPEWEVGNFAIGTISIVIGVLIFLAYI